ncbi:MAG: hypothetical protein WA510_02755 [Acidobacteriaceae bacterium]
MQPFPERLVEIGLAMAGTVGVLILIAPNFGMKPKQLVDGWRFPVKPTCLLLYYLALGVGIGSVGFSASLLLSHGAALWFAWVLFAFGFAVVPFVLADWPEPLILDGQGLLEGPGTSRRIRWQELTHVRVYRIRYDRGLVIQGIGGKELVIPNIAYDSNAVLACLLQWQRVPYYSRQDETAPLSIFSRHR